jgi:hypothetical protein
MQEQGDPMLPSKINYPTLAFVYLVALPLFAQNVAISTASKQLADKTNIGSGRFGLMGNETQFNVKARFKLTPQDVDPRITTMIEKALKQKSIQSQNVIGGGDAGGGDDVGLDFQSSARSALDKVKRGEGEVFKNLDTDYLTQILNRTQFFVVDDALDVSIVDLIQTSVAVNIPEAEMVFINRTKWTHIKNESLKEGIALHELLSLARLEQTGYYPISSQYVAMMGISDEALLENLRINSLAKTSAEIQGGTPFEILKKLYNSSIEPARFNDFELSKRREFGKPLIGRQCVTASAEIKTAVTDDIMTVYSHTYEFGSPAQGPLFPNPTQDKTRLILIPDRWVQDFHKNKIDEMALSLTVVENRTDLIMTETKKGLYSPLQFSFRYQNGLIAYKVSNRFGTENGSERYGYCWRN